MANKTSIEWTDFNWSINPNIAEGNALDKGDRRAKAFACHPFVHVFRSFRRITTSTRGNNIVRRGSAAMRDWNYMIEGVGGPSAVSAASIKFQHQKFLADRRNRINISPSRASFLTTLISKLRILSVKSSSVLPLMLWTSRIAHGVGRTEHLTANTPGKTIRNRQFFTIARAWLTLRLESVVTRFVFMKLSTVFPQFAFSTSCLLYTSPSPRD